LVASQPLVQLTHLRIRKVVAHPSILTTQSGCFLCKPLRNFFIIAAGVLITPYAEFFNDLNRPNEKILHAFYMLLIYCFFDGAKPRA
jgi:hypothetical protein